MMSCECMKDTPAAAWRASSKRVAQLPKSFHPGHACARQSTKAVSHVSALRSGSQLPGLATRVRTRQKPENDSMSMQGS